MRLPFGKKVMCGNFYVLKHTRALSSKELKKLRKAEGIPEDIQRHLSRGVLPYITVGTVSDSWKIQFGCPLDIFKKIDEIPVAIDSEGNYTYYGDDYKYFGNIINHWLATTATVGDTIYQAQSIIAMQDYLARMSGKPMSDEEKEKVKKDVLEKMQGVIDRLSPLKATEPDFQEELLSLHKDIRLLLNRLFVTEDHSQPLPKEENEKVLKEEEDTERHKKVLLDMADEIRNGGTSGKA